MNLRKSIQGNDAARWVSRTWRTGPLVALGMLLATLPVLAAGYPDAADDHLCDFAAILTAEQHDELWQLLKQHREETGVHVVAVTVRSFDDYGTDASSVEEFTTGLFNHWGVGDATANDGVMLLLAHADRKVRIEVGSGYGRSLDGAMKTIIDRDMVPRFRAGDFGGGLLAGAQSVVAQLNGEDAGWSSKPLPVAAPPSGRSQRSWWAETWDDLSGWPAWIAGILAFFGGGVGLAKVRRNRPRKCPECDNLMVRLDEQSDDAYLGMGQRAEESSGSIDYDVWHCHGCDVQTIESYRNLFSRYRMCPGCGHRVMSTERTRLRSPTRYRTGSDLIRSRCLHCKYRNERKVVVPMVSDDHDSDWGSSSSSGGSSGFGGGSSSGGGASGSW